RQRLEREESGVTDRPEGNARLRVGLIWSDEPTTTAGQVPNSRRRCGMADLAPLAGVPGVRCYVLRRRDAAREALNPPAGMTLVDPGGELNGFDDAAALMMNLDLVITVDSAEAHLAGALGRPVWTLLPYADWRWMAGR